MLSYRAVLPAGVRILHDDPNDTNSFGRNVTMVICADSVYPIQATQQQQQCQISGDPIRYYDTITNNLTYDRVYDVLNLMGIVIAEQIRFDSLEHILDRDVIPNPGSRVFTLHQLFNYLYDTFKEPVYNNWTSDQTIFNIGGIQIDRIISKQGNNDATTFQQRVNYDYDDNDVF